MTKPFRSSKKNAPATLAACILAAGIFASGIFASCTFDYGDELVRDVEQPDLVMLNVEYVRVRSASLVARFNAERAERFEDRQIMEIENFSFEQFGDDENDVSAWGWAGAASVEMDTSNISMTGGVMLEVEFEDFTIETPSLEWRDEERILFTGTDEMVTLHRSNGTNFSGYGFRANARTRAWEFSGGASGTFIHDEDEDDGEEE